MPRPPGMLRCLSTSRDVAARLQPRLYGCVPRALMVRPDRIRARHCGRDRDRGAPKHQLDARDIQMMGNLDRLLFNGWFAVGRTVVVGALAYIGLIVLLRASGKRTLSKMNAFDLVVTVALGSTLATIILSAEVSLAQGLVALALLIALQFAITWSSVRWRWVRGAVTGEPSLLCHRGEYLHRALRLARVTEEELRAAVRGAGYADPEHVESVVLETDGSFSVVPRSAAYGVTVAEPRRTHEPDRG
jgi:uncharacterized membrane protein YcaP (DUF421 family)